MRQAVSVLLVLASGLLGTGCSSDPYAKFNLGPARDVVAGSIDAVGGLKAWQGVDKIRATAVVAYYQPSGQADIDRLAVTLDFQAGRITAEGLSPQGPWPLLSKIIPA